MWANTDEFAIAWLHHEKGWVSSSADLTADGQPRKQVCPDNAPRASFTKDDRSI